MKRVILASGSPRRKELLEMMGIEFEVMVSDKEEVVTDTDPILVTKELSRQKAEAVAEEIEEGIVIGSDTVVSVDGKILGKPVDKADALQMIDTLQGRSHMVYTGVTIINKGKRVVEVETFAEGTKVHVAKMTKEEMEAYCNTSEPYDKAGSYAVQGVFAKHIEGIEGDYFNVVGLPVHTLYEKLKDMIESFF